jgi:hypothetical protein
MKKTSILLLCFLLNLAAIAQKRKVEKIANLKIPNLKIAYAGNSHPGVKLGAEFMFKNKQITARRKGDKLFVSAKQNYLTVSITAYEHYAFKNNLMLSVEWLKRKTFQNGLFAEGAIGIGLSKGINKEPKTFKQGDDGSLKTLKPATAYFPVLLSGGGGYDFSKKAGNPFRVYVKGGVNTIFYHRFLYTIITAEVGVVTSLSFFKRK